MDISYNDIIDRWWLIHVPVGLYYPIDWRFSGSLSKSEQNERNQPV